MDRLEEIEARHKGDPDIEYLLAEVRRLRQDCAEAYQCVGYLDGDTASPHDFERLLDNLSAAASGLPRPHEDLLPWPTHPAPDEQP